VTLDQAIYHGMIAMKVRIAELRLRAQDPKNHHFKDQINEDIRVYVEAVEVIKERQLSQ
jgi:hypothetical protein